MGWFEELDEHPDRDDLGRRCWSADREPLDWMLFATGIFLLCVGAFLVGVGVFLTEAWLSGGVLLLWTWTRRAMEYRAVKAFNRRDRPLGTLDDAGFVE